MDCQIRGLAIKDLENSDIYIKIEVIIILNSDGKIK
jgi:hypothetical protein